ncbi:MAG TPA: hypothetical protein VKA21_12975, partial [Candidatus Binatia bacterium]|nr:hypothetical protein [Candidatus Binatia bacterium]
GELVVEGPSVSPRYFGEPATAAREGLRTGDLAYRVDGRVYVVDRLKDLVIVAGQNYAPSDLEAVAAQVAGVRPGRVVVFSAPGSAGTEAVHVVAEASVHSWRAPAAIESDVRGTLRRDVGLSAATVTIVAPGTLERTSSGKVKRRSCAEAHGRGALAALRTPADVLLFRWARRRDRELARVAGAVRAAVQWVSARRPRA